MMPLTSPTSAAISTAVLDLVREHAGQLLGRLGALEQAAEDDDEASRDREGVHHLVVHDDHAERVAVLGRRAQQDARDLVDVALPLVIVTTLVGRRQLRQRALAERHLPRHRHPPGGDVREPGDPPLVERQRERNGRDGGDHAERGDVAATRRIVERGRRVGRGRAQRRQERDVTNQQRVGELAAVLETHLLARVEALGLAHPAERPAERAARVAQRDLEAAPADRDARGLPHGRAAVEVLGVPDAGDVRQPVTVSKARGASTVAAGTARIRWSMSRTPPSTNASPPARPPRTSPTQWALR
jgi:hypothetical protein